MQETTYKYVGCGGDFDTVRPRRDFTCLITTGCLLGLLLLIPLLCWLLSGMATTEMFDCTMRPGMPLWSEEQKEFCCATTGFGCPITEQPTAQPTAPPQPTPPRPLPPTAPPAPTPPADPFNCAVGEYPSWM